MTLAQVFWMKERQGQPAAFSSCAERELSIAGTSPISERTLGICASACAATARVPVRQLPAYGARLRRRLGIDNEQALELFHQTVSMKSVGNLTDFVRRHMLEPFDGRRASTR